MEYSLRPQKTPPRRSAAIEAIVICTAVAGLLVFAKLELELTRQLDGLDIVVTTGEKLRAMLPWWALVAGILAYDVLVLRFSGLLLSTWGYVWRTWVIGSIGNLILEGLHAWAPWNVGTVDSVFVWILSPWLLAWSLLRIEEAKRPPWSGS